MSRGPTVHHDGKTYSGWLCDEAGCDAYLHPIGFVSWEASGWHKCSKGFMVHRCPTHAPAWRTYDEASRAVDHARDAAYAQLYAELVAALEALCAEAFPELEPPSELYGNNLPAAP